MKLSSLVRIGTGVATIGLLSSSLAGAATVGRVAPLIRHAAPHTILLQAHRMSPPSCPSEFTGGCYSITSASPFEAEWCVSDSGNCTSGLVSSVSWTSANFLAKNGKAKKNSGKFSSVWSPNPGNPSTITVSTSKAKAKGKVKYGVSLSGCYSAGCFTDFETYGFQV
jgi:hypothetical protein